MPQPTEAPVKNVLVLCPTSREYRDLVPKADQLNCRLIFDDFGDDYFDRLLAADPDEDIKALDMLALLDQTVEKHKHEKLDGVTSAVGYPGMSATAVLSKRLGLPGPDPEPILLCEHKYYARVAQQRHVPEATPWFWIIDPNEPRIPDSLPPFPLFLKPVKSCMSANAHRIESMADLKKHAESALLPELFIKPFNDLVRKFTNWERHASYLLLEGMLSGHQVSLEGFVHNGKVTVMAIIDAIMFPGTFSFKRFQYPSRLPEKVQARMCRIAELFIKGIGYDNAMFNFEMMYNPHTDAIGIIEVNPKIASQFPDLLEKVDGTSSYSVLLQIALGQTPEYKFKQGKYKVSASCVLRVFEDQYVHQVPSKEDITEIEKRYPDTIVQVIATPGKKLSDQVQDSYSYRYGLVHIGADSEQELEQKFEDIKRLLPYKLEPVQSKACG